MIYFCLQASDTGIGDARFFSCRIGAKGGYQVTEQLPRFCQDDLDEYAPFDTPLPPFFFFFLLRCFRFRGVFVLVP